MGNVKEGTSIREHQQVLAMVSQAFIDRCRQEMMHRHTQRINEGMLVMVALTSSSWKCAQSRGACTEQGRMHRAQVMVDVIFLERHIECRQWHQHRLLRKAHKEQAMASKRDKEREIERERASRLLRPTHTQTQRKSIVMLLGPRHTYSKKESQFLKGDTNIREGVEREKE